METTQGTASNNNKATDNCPHGSPLELKRKVQRVIPSVWLLNDAIWYEAKAARQGIPCGLSIHTNSLH